MRSTNLIYRAAGEPEIETTTAGTCRCCGESDRGIPFKNWIKDSFNDGSYLLPGDICCRACLFSFAESNAFLQSKLKKDKPQKFRSYSHFVLDGEWRVYSKGNKREIANTLFQDPEVAVVSISGQKHLAFKCKPGWWQIEEQQSQPFPGQLARLMHLVERLYCAGASKEEIEFGHYSQFALQRVGFSLWKELESQIKPYRGSLPLQLAVYLAQQEEQDGSRSDSASIIDADLAGN